jgi:MEMO1 family protein
MQSGVRRGGSGIGFWRKPWRIVEVSITHMPFAPSSLPIAVLMPHPPVVIPEVGGRRGEDAEETMRAMRACAGRVLAAQPDTVVVISPHAPRRPRAFGVWENAQLRGSFARFGAPDAVVGLPNDHDLAAAIAREAEAMGLPTWPIQQGELDHGATVPLWYLCDAGWRGPTVVIGLNYPGEGGLEKLGLAIAGAARKSQRRVALVASGDMSHRLKPGAPSGFHPQATDFDRAFIDRLRASDYRGILRLDAELQELAAEDVVDSTVIALAAVDWNSTGAEVLSYEGPFGVGYGVAVLYEAAREAVPAFPGEGLPAIARQSIEAAFRNGSQTPPAPAGDALHQRRGVFVTIRSADGKLRGCIGSLTPRHGNVVEETWHMARQAAFHDNRFDAIREAELPSISFEVSMLGPLEDIASRDELDPACYGVIVRTEDGRRGTLLPGLAGVTTVEEQLAIACRKARIEPDEPITLQRYTVDKFREPDFVEADD